MKTEFNKYNVISQIKKLVPPTPTDEDHQADWWNEQFGMKIKTSVEMMLEGLITDIETRMVK